MSAFRVVLLVLFALTSAHAEVPGAAQTPAALSTAKAKSKKKGNKRKRRKKGRSRSKGAASKRQEGWSLRVSSMIRAGYAHGLAQRPLDAATTISRLRLVPHAHFPAFSLRAPFSVRHQYYWGEPLSETRVTGDLEAELKVWRSLRPVARFGTVYVWRPTWPDLYQPLGSGDYVHTGRFSYWQRELALGVELNPVRRSELELWYSYALRTYARDPAFDPIGRPNHLAPADRDEHRVTLQWTWRVDRARLQTTLSAFEHSYFFWFARDGGTGRTHAGPGGPPPNPLYQTVGLRPGIELRWEFGDSLSARPAYELELLEDTFAGYRSSVTHRPSLDVEVEASRRVRLSASATLALRRYGENSYAAGPGHPPLTFGDQRLDRKFVASAGARYAWFDRAALTFSFELVRRRTNLPPYEPGVFPAGANYDIDWNYDTVRLLCGFEHE